MKKIYFLTAVLALLTLSLNAQVANSAQKYKANNKAQISGQDKGQPAQSNGAMRAPNRYNAADGEFLVGPYTTDDYSTTGKGLYTSNFNYSSGRTEVSTVIPRSEIEQYIGQEIVGYRFATVGGTTSCYRFLVEIEGPNLYIDDLYTWDLQSSGYYVNLSGNQWHEYYLNEPVVFQIPDTTQAIWIGYQYYQESSSYGDYTMTPIAVNPNVTSYECYAYNYSNEEFYDVTSHLGGAVAAQLIFKNTVEKTPSPTINMVDNGNGTYTITATGNGNVTLTIGNQTETGTGSASITIAQGNADQTVTATATAQDGELAVSNPTTENFTIPALPKTATPTITYQVTDNSVIITATGNGTVTLNAGGQTASGEGTATITIARTLDEQTVTATATAIEPNHQESDPATQTITIPEAGRSPMPTITYEVENGYVVITATGEGTVTLKVDGQTYTGEGSVSATIVRSLDDRTVTATATAKDGDLAESRPATEDVLIPALSTTPTAQTKEGLLRLHLLIVDQMLENIPADNSHPDRYGYVLRYEPNGADGEGARESGTVDVRIQKADCEVMGAYTLTEVDNDKNIGRNHDEGIKMQVITADVAYDLSSTNDMLYEYILQGAENRLPNYNQDYLTRLQKTQNFTYVEMLDDAPDKGHEYPNGEHHYFSAYNPVTGVFNADDLVTGAYGSDYMTYAPSVSTWGVQRRYFEDDGLDNTYGAPFWKTSAGKVTMDDSELFAERQINKNNSVNWTTDAGPASLYILDGVKAVGLLPHTDKATVQYEPYMFRIFVESPSGKLRPYKVVPKGDGTYDGEHLDALVPDSELTEAQKYGPISIWESYIKYDEDGNIIGDDAVNGVQITTAPDVQYQDQTAYTFVKNKVDRPDGYSDNDNPLGPWDQDNNNAMFGALNAISPETGTISTNDLKVFVRFYYMVKGWNANSMSLRAGEGEGEGDEARPGNGAESGGGAAGVATAVNEITYQGEVVETLYYNVQGMVSDKPFDGVNIVVTRFGNGTTSVSKIVR